MSDVERVAGAIQRAWTPEAMESDDPPRILAEAAIAALGPLADARIADLEAERDKWREEAETRHRKLVASRKRRADLEAEVERLKVQVENWKRVKADRQPENTRLREALDTIAFGPLGVDRRAVARAALASLEGERGTECS